MQRPRQHEIDDLGQNLLRDVFARLGWVVREIPTDYGLDFEIEIFNSGKSTGAIFKVQLKSSESTRYSSDGQFISQPLDVRSANYLCRELRLPVVLVHADVVAKRIFWTAPQLETQLVEKLVAQRTGTTITVRVPVANELPIALNPLLQAVGAVATLLASRRVAEAPIQNFLSSIDTRIDKDGLSQVLKDKSDALRLSKADELFRARRYQDARERVLSVIQDTAASIESKFWAWWSLERIEHTAMLKAGVPLADIHNWHGRVAREMQLLTGKGPAYLKFYALIARKAAELGILAYRELGLLTNWKVHEKEGDPLWRLHLHFERAANLRRTGGKYEQCLRLAGYARNSTHRWALPQALLHIVNAAAIFIARLNAESLRETAERCRESAFQICRLAAWIAGAHGNYEDLGLAALSAMMLTRNPESEEVRWARDTISTIPAEASRVDAEQRFERNLRRYRGEKLEGDIRVTPQQAYESMAAALGIDLSDPNDRIARLVRIGIADYDPTRVLRNCEHLFISLGPHGLIADRLRLPSAGSKLIHCVPHQQTIQSLTLDGAYESFKRQYCDQCPDASPRPPGWQWSEQWQQEENKRHEAYMKRFGWSDE
jgi:hypothetical protein